jgi:guanylate kinase
LEDRENIDRELDKEMKSYLQPCPLVVVISGLSGVGKDVVLKGMREQGYIFHRVVTATTRRPRHGEVDGVDYDFVSEDEYQAMLDRGELLEHAVVYGELYGVPEREIQDPLDRGEDAVMRTDVQGAATIKEKIPEAVLIFLTASSMEELRRRLTGRGQNSPNEMDRRLNTARDEMRYLPKFDYVVVNRDGRLDEAVRQVMTIVTAEKRRVIRICAQREVRA